VAWATWRCWTRAIPLCLGLAIARVGPAAALDVGFDDLPSLSDVANATLPGVSVSTALVLSETDAVALGYPALGTFATSGTQGLLNTLAPAVTFTFTAPVTSFSIDILSLARDGVTLPIQLRAFGGGPNPISSTTSDPSRIGDSGYHEQRLAVAAQPGTLFSSVDLVALTGCGGSLCPSTETSTFWLDSASFTPVPEPGSMALLGGGLALLAGLGRGKGGRS